MSKVLASPSTMPRTRFPAQSVQTLVSACVLAAVAAGPLMAQVGHLPDRSPYRDEKIGQTLSLMAGHMSPRRDPADVRPLSGTTVGLRYDASIGGPTALFARYFVLTSERQMILPGEHGDARFVGMKDVTVHIADLGLDIALTGNKSWHRTVPSVIAGLGMATDAAGVDSGGYKFGNKFTVSYGAALRVVPGGRFSYRLEATNYYWRYEYPDAYFVRAADEGAIISNARSRGAWRFNWNIAAGVTWQLFKQ